MSSSANAGRNASMSAAAAVRAKPFYLAVKLTGPERSFVTIARDATGSWDQADASILNDGPSHVIRTFKRWETVVSHVCAALVHTLRRTNDRVGFVDCRSHIGWFASIAALHGASDIILIEDTKLYADVALLNVKYASADAICSVFPSLGDAKPSLWSCASVMRLHGYHYDPHYLSFVALAAATQCKACVVDLMPSHVERAEIVEFVRACTSVFFIVTVGAPESLTITQRSSVHMVHDANVVDILTQARTTGVVLAMIRKSEDSHELISSVATAIESLQT